MLLVTLNVSPVTRSLCIFYFLFLVVCPNFSIPTFYIPFQNSISLARNIFQGYEMRFCTDFPVLLCPDDDYLASLYSAAGTHSLERNFCVTWKGLDMGDKASQAGMPHEEKYYPE